MPVKKCSKCKELKDIQLFNFRNKVRQRRNSHCKTCTKKASKKSYRNRREYYIQANYELKQKRKKMIMLYVLGFLGEHPCVDCGESNPVVLTFDHVQGKKVGNIGTMIATGFALKTIKAEIAKCVVRCANCHAIKTSKELRYYNH